MGKKDMSSNIYKGGDPENWEKLSCCVCSSGETTRLYDSFVSPDEDLQTMFWGLHRTQERKKFHTAIQKCTGCGHVYSSPYLKEDVLRYCYATSHFDNSWQVADKFPLSTVRHYLNEAMPFLPDRECAVDIGCDVGFLLEVACEAGFKKVVGVEPNKTAADRAWARLKSRPNVDILNEAYSEQAISPGSASLIAFVHVLDHLKQPNTLLKAVYKDLKPGGVVIAVMHNIKSILARLTGRRFPPINLQHPQFFSPNSLRLLFVRAGFEFLKIRPTFNDYPLSHYIRYMPFMPEWVKDRLVPLLNRNGASCGLSLPLGNMIIVARKPF